MTYHEAITALNESKPLAQWLLTHSAIFPYEVEILTKFLEVIEAGYSNDPQILELAGLSQLEYSCLLDRLNYHLTRTDDDPLPYLSPFSIN